MRKLILLVFLIIAADHPPRPNPDQPLQNLLKLVFEMDIARRNDPSNHHIKRAERALKRAIALARKKDGNRGVGSSSVGDPDIDPI